MVASLLPGVSIRERRAWLRVSALRYNNLGPIALRPNDLHHDNGDSNLPATMASLLPDDLLHMICHQLWEQRDFDTLYHCARAGKQLAVPALASIYRYTRPCSRTRIRD